MGVTNAFQKANDLLASELHYRLDPEQPNLEFRQRLYVTGWARFEHCVALVKLYQRDSMRGRHLHARLMDLMRMVTPAKEDDRKYRSPLSEKGRETHRDMDMALADRIAREP